MSPTVSPRRTPSAARPAGVPRTRPADSANRVSSAPAGVAGGPDQMEPVKQLAGPGGGSLVLVAVEVMVLDRPGSVGEPCPADDLVVEVLAAGAHAADVEGRRGAGVVQDVVDRDVVTDGHP